MASPMLRDMILNFGCPRATDLSRRQPLCATFPGTSRAVRSALARVTRELTRHGVAAVDRTALELVLAEVMNNIVEHAYAEAGGGRIELTISRAPGGLDCEVVDDGRPMPGGTLPVGRPVPLDCAARDLPEGGFGWFLIREMASEVRYVRQQGRNRLRFVLPLAQPAHLPAHAS